MQFVRFLEQLIGFFQRYFEQQQFLGLELLVFRFQQQRFEQRVAQQLIIVKLLVFQQQRFEFVRFNQRIQQFFEFVGFKLLVFQQRFEQLRFLVELELQPSARKRGGILWLRKVLHSTHID